LNARLEHGPQSWECAVAHNELGVACKHAARLDEAEAAYAVAWPVAERMATTRPELLVTLLHNLAGLCHARGDFAEAERLANRGVQLRRTRCPDPAGIASDTAALAAILEGQERWGAAEHLYREALEAWRDLGDDHEIGMTLNGLAAVVRFGGRPAEAEPLFREALHLLEGRLGPAHPDAATVRNNLAMLLRATNRSALAIPLLEQTLADLDASLGADHPASIDVRNNLDRTAGDSSATSVQSLSLHDTDCTHFNAAP